MAGQPLLGQPTPPTSSYLGGWIGDLWDAGKAMLGGPSVLSKMQRHHDRTAELAYGPGGLKSTMGDPELWQLGGEIADQFNFLGPIKGAGGPAPLGGRLYRGAPEPETALQPRDFPGVYLSRSRDLAGQYGPHVSEWDLDQGARLLDLGDSQPDGVAAALVRAFHAGRGDPINPRAAEDLQTAMAELFMRPEPDWADFLRGFGYRGASMGDDVFLLDGDLARRAAPLGGGLDMSTEARMGRAREMGFDVERPLYHGTPADVPAFDLDRAGTAAGSEGQRGVFMTPDPAEASHYAEVMGAVDPLDAANPMARLRPGDPRYDMDYVGSNVLPLLHRPGKAKEITVKGYDTARFEREIEKARKQGYDTLTIKGANEHGRAETQVVALRPENVRSVHAAFDPAKRTSADLLASMAPLGLGLGGAGLLYPPEQP